jgi:hypothetical protein
MRFAVKTASGVWDYGRLKVENVTQAREQLEAEYPMMRRLELWEAHRVAA